MITTGDIANIIYRDCGVFGMERVIFGEKKVEKDGFLIPGKITIIVKDSQEEKFWWKTFVEVNFCIPDLKNKSDRVRLDELQSQAYGLWYNKTVTGEYNDTRYKYTLYTSSQLEESTLKCHYINARLLFQVLNVK